MIKPFLKETLLDNLELFKSEDRPLIKMLCDKYVVTMLKCSRITETIQTNDIPYYIAAPLRIEICFTCGEGSGNLTFTLNGTN